MIPQVKIPGYVNGETIAALSSRGGDSPRAVVRTSGQDALRIWGEVFTADAEVSDQAASKRLSRGWLKLEQGVRCPCLAYVFRGPGSYTGEDSVEYHLPGGTALVQMALGTLMAAGARAAEPGEFTLRAFLEGRIDLAQAEAVSAIISSQTDGQLRAANSLAEGVLSRAVGKVQGVLAELIADVEANIDFVDQDIDFIDAARTKAGIEDLRQEVARLVADAVRLRDLENEPWVVLAGAANVGKSTLLNSLAGSSRAIVSGLAGTTRDVLTAPMTLRGPAGMEQEVLLADAAGLCDSALDEVGIAAREAALRAVRRADLVLYVLDGAVDIRAEDWQRLQILGAKLVLIVVNKIDLLSERQSDKLLRELREQQRGVVVGVSAKTGAGLEGLREKMAEHLRGTDMPHSQARLALTVRAEEGLAQAREALGRAGELVQGWESLDSPELLAVELYEANAALGMITGQVTSEEVLADIFGRFCVGK